MEILERINKWFHRKDLEWLRANGYAMRGRQDPAALEQMREDRKTMGGAVIHAYTSLTARHLRKNPETGKYEEVDRREVLNRKVTTAFVNDIVDNLITETTQFGDYKWHDSGTGTNAESPSDTGLQTPCGESRTSGSQIEGAQTYEYKSVATHTYAGSFSITEHGLFNNSAGGTLMDRTVFTAIGVGSGDKIEFTFTIQFSAEA